LWKIANCEPTNQKSWLNTWFCTLLHFIKLDQI